MRGAESIIDENLGKCRQLPGELRIVLLLGSGEAGIFQQDDITGLHCGDLCLRIRADRIGCEHDATAQQLIELIGNDGERQLLSVLGSLLKRGGAGSLLLLGGQSLDLGNFLLVQLEFLVQHVVGFAHVGAENDHGAVCLEVPDGRQSLHDTLVGGDDTVLHRHVEVTANQYLFAGYVDVFDGFLVVRHTVFHLSLLWGSACRQSPLSHFILYHNRFVFARGYL